ncbi:MAG: ATP-dependent protease [Hyphomicrobiales bacterium]|nr:MAG: ATP-dependent protease [Hyphomicrobiales bacterium]
MKAGNAQYDGPEDLPATVPIFPLQGALLLPRGRMPLNIFEPRYVTMIDDALRGDRIIGMIQPELAGDADETSHDPNLCTVGCLGRLVAYQESGDGRYLITLTGIVRFRIAEELAVTTPYRQCRIDTEPFRVDYTPHFGEDAVDRAALLDTFRAYLEAKDLETDWDSVEKASNEALVNALAMMSPYGPAEKQALLEAPDLKSRAETLIAMTEVDLARGDGDMPSRLQ